jgi:hypothetical protein
MSSEVQQVSGSRSGQVTARDSKVHSSWVNSDVNAATVHQINEFRVSTSPTLNMASIADGQATVQCL